MNFFIIKIKLNLQFLLYPLYLIMFTRILIELNRTPFDLIESELVSSFNIEYSWKNICFNFFYLNI